MASLVRSRARSASSSVSAADRTRTSPPAPVLVSIASVRETRWQPCRCRARGCASASWSTVLTRAYSDSHCQYRLFPKYRHRPSARLKGRKRPACGHSRNRRRKGLSTTELLARVNCDQLSGSDGRAPERARPAPCTVRSIGRCACCHGSSTARYLVQCRLAGQPAIPNRRSNRRQGRRRAH